MRIRSVEIVFEDEISLCTEAASFDERSLELVDTDSSDDSTKCLDLEHLQIEKDSNDDSITLSGEPELLEHSDIESKDDIVKYDTQDISKIETIHISVNENVIEDSSNIQTDSLLLVTDDISLSLNLSEFGDSGRYTEEASSSHFEIVPIPTYDDALLSHSFDNVNTENKLILVDVVDDKSLNSDISQNDRKLYEYIDSNSDSSDNTAICDVDSTQANNLTCLHLNQAVHEDPTVCDSSDLQYDSFVDMGKF